MTMRCGGTKLDIRPIPSWGWADPFSDLLDAAQVVWDKKDEAVVQYSPTSGQLWFSEKQVLGSLALALVRSTTRLRG